jgi:hypothetical protein
MTLYNHKIHFVNGMYMTLKNVKDTGAEIMNPKNLSEEGSFTFEAVVDGKKCARTYRPKYVVLIESEEFK